MSYLFASWRNSGPQAAVFSIWLASTVSIAAVSIILTGGHLVYTLDDPYIHLAVANSIIHGGYGVNITENSSPSSSILYPYILTVTTLLGLDDYGPLVINILFSAITVMLLIKILSEFFELTGGERFVLAMGLVFASSSFALPMTGMEHSIHVAACVATLYGLIKLAQGAPAPPSLIAGIIAMPLLRFEGAALTGGALLAVGILGHYRLTLILSAAVALSFLLYLRFVSLHGLPLLPSSVLLKSNVAASFAGETDMVSAIFSHIEETLKIPQAQVLALLAALLAPKALLFLMRTDKSPEGAVALAAEAAAIGHLAGGNYGWFSRYEVYAVCTALIATLFVYRPRAGSFLRKPAFLTGAVIIIALAVKQGNYFTTALQTPKASRSIYEQQYQMHRFAADFLKEPVAVNDLGLVSYQNPNFVLDLFGLGSEPVRKAKVAGIYGREFIDRITEEHNIVAAMVYDSLFGDQLPLHWTKLAVLESQPVTARDGQVTIYATSDKYVTRVTGALEKFGATVPERVKLTMLLDRK
jgi:hypothetical protein